jgi:GNAT superfamily N-acetyltransferase
MSEADRIVIRPARLDEVPALQSLIAESVRALSRDDYSPDAIERAIVRVFGVDTALIADGTYFVAVDGDRIVGCGGWSRRATLYGGDQMKSGTEPQLRPGLDPARIRAFFVAPSHARQGIGRRVLAACEAAARASRFTVAELVATRPGERLYAACGYEAVEPVSVDLGDGCSLPCTRMRKTLV